MLALTFEHKEDYEKILEDDHIDIIGLKEFKPGVPLKVKLHHKNGNIEEFNVMHSYNELQIKWFQAGSALNLIRQENKKL